MKPVSARLPVSAISRSRPTSRSISAHSAPVRWSFQRIAGRMTRSSAASATRPCIWPDRPIGPSGSLARHACVARHQSSGSCSAQPGWGVESGYGSSALAISSPSAEIAMPLTPDVPTSSPMQPTLGTQRGVDELVRADSVLRLLRLPQGGLVDLATRRRR